MRRATPIVASLALGVLLAGCCKSEKTAQASMGMFRSSKATLSLGAGDALGRAVYVNDIVLAARANNLDTSAIANVQRETSFMLGD